MVASYSELHGSPQESWNDGGYAATRQLICDWNDRHELMGDLYGTVYPYIAPVSNPAYVAGTTYGAGDLVSYGGFAWKSLQAANTGNQPDISPTWWQYILSGVAYVLGFEAQPYSTEEAQLGTGSTTDYEKALVTVYYGRTASGGDPTSTAAYSESLEPTAEFLTLDYSEYTWGDDSGAAKAPVLKENESPGRLVRGLDYIFTRYNQTTVPSAALSLVGFVNTAAVTASSLGITFGAQTLLFNPPTISRTVDATGVGSWTITYRMTYKPNWQGGVEKGWNWFWRAEEDEYQQIYHKWTSSVVAVYPNAAFTGF